MLKVDISSLTVLQNSHHQKILGNIFFDLGIGKIYTILGKNGSGKSTLIKSLTMLLNKNIYTTIGNVYWNNENIFQMNEERSLNLRKKEIRYVLQDLNNNFDPLKNIKYYFDKSGSTEEQISVELKNYLLPGYDSISNLHPYEISGGMAQRLSFMLALLPHPNLLILDEPTSAIDYSNVNLIKLKLKEIALNSDTALIVTQDIIFAKEVSDQIAYLDQGTLTEFVDVKSFFSESNSKKYQNFLSSFEGIQ
jgi:ABC-type dipeptide/oligopeptide/nickel transport system ATPase component